MNNPNTPNFDTFSSPAVLGDQCIYRIQGNEVYCYTGGKKLNPELPTLVLIHGAQNDHSVWKVQSDSLAHHRHNILAPDLPGHGRSSGDALTSIEAMATWLLALLDVTGIRKAILAGHSMGSLIALEVARCAPDRVAKLALLGTAHPMKVADTLLAAAHDNEPAAIELVTGWSHHVATPTIQDETKRLMQRMSAINPAHLLYTDLSACNQYAHGEEAATVIHQHHCPTLFIIAKQDRMTPAKASAQLRSAIPHATVVEIAQCGHALMSEQPDAVLTTLIDFLK